MEQTKPRPIGKITEELTAPRTKGKPTRVISTTIPGRNIDLDAKRRQAEADKAAQQAARKAARQTAKRRLFAFGAGVGLATGAALGIVVDDAVDASKANEAQPACDVRVTDEIGADVIKQRITNAGDNVMGEHFDMVRPDGVVRDEDNTRGFYLNGSKGMQPGDRERVQNVDPNICVQLGGVVVADQVKK